MGEELLTTESTRPLLTIAIPNFNRAGYLKELLSLLAAQLRNEPRVELIISDNASPDETPAVVQDFVARGLRVRYTRNVQNIGSDANFLQCFEQAGSRSAASSWSAGTLRDGRRESTAHRMNTNISLRRRNAVVVFDSKYGGKVAASDSQSQGHSRR